MLCCCCSDNVLQTITHMIDDVLSDSLLHKAVQPGEIAFMELSRRSGQPVCTGEHWKAPKRPHVCLLVWRSRARL